MKGAEAGHLDRRWHELALGAVLDGPECDRSGRVFVEDDTESDGHVGHDSTAPWPVTNERMRRVGCLASSRLRVSTPDPPIPHALGSTPTPGRTIVSVQRCPVSAIDAGENG